jgi:primase-polymerase (primpol)-like protein
MTTMVTSPFITDTIPEELKRGKRFTAWRFENRKGQAKPAKMPYSPDAPKGASSTDPATWTTFDDAVKYARVAGLNGIMRAFDHADGLIGTDLDNCLDPSIPDPGLDDLAPWAAEYVKRLDTYTEVSPTGTGVKLWARGTMPAFGHKKGDVEMYGSVAGQTGPCGRLFTQTGRHLQGTPREVCYRPDAVLAIHREVFGDTPDVTAPGDGDLDRPIPALEIGDEDVLKLASESPHNGEKFRRLWSGDTSGYAVDGNDGESEAECALAEIIFYYGGPDRDRADRLFRRSGLYREKWERTDYRKRTFDRALKGKTRFYGDSIKPPAATGSDGASSCTCEDCPARLRMTYLEHALLDRDDLVEFQQSVITTQRARLDVLERYKTHIQEVVTRDENECPSDDKVVLIGFVPWLQTYRAKQIANGEPTAFSLKYGATVIGMHHKRFSNVLGRWSSPNPNDGAPWYKKVTRTPVTNDDGSQGWDSALEVTPWRETPQEILRASLAYVPPVLPKKRGGSEKTSAHRWERCWKHPAVMINLQGRCSAGGELLGEVHITPEAFDALKSRFGISDGGQTDTVADSTLSRSGNGISDPTLGGNGLKVQPVDLAPVSLPDYAAIRPQKRPERCPAPRCTALGFRDLPDGSWRCLKSNHDPSMYVPAVAGAETGPSSGSTT